MSRPQAARRRRAIADTRDAKARAAAVYPQSEYLAAQWLAAVRLHAGSPWRQRLVLGSEPARPGGVRSEETA